MLDYFRGFPADPQGAERVHPFPGNVLVHVQDMGEGESQLDSPEQVRRETRTEVTDLDQAMILTSKTERTTITRWDVDGRHDLGEDLHRPVLDLDMPAALVPSSTPGHFHLMINHAMTWDRYVVLLDALADAGLIEPGYVRAAKERGHTGVRVPWFRKGDQPAYVLDPESGELIEQSDELVEAEVGVDPWVVSSAPAHQWGGA